MNADGTVSDAPPALPAASPTVPGDLDAALPKLATLVTERKRVFSVGLDPDAEQTAAEWFESLGYRTITGDTHYTKAGTPHHSPHPRIKINHPSFYEGIFHSTPPANQWRRRLKGGALK